MNFLDLFAGIGGFRLGMESAGHECIGFCEVDKFARASYKAIHDTEGEIELHDITTVTDEEIRAIGHVDVICGGFPCQAFSIAGHRRGFEDTRGTLFFEIARFADILKPKYLFLENVKGLLNHDRGNTFKTILGALDGLGYDVEWQVLNSKNFFVPQNRERVFIIGHLRGQRTRNVFPLIRENEKSDNQQSKIEIVGNTKNPNGTGQGTGSKVYDLSGLIGTLSARDYKEPKQVAIPVGRESQSISSRSVIKIGNVNPSGKGMNGEVYNSQGLAPTLTTNKGEGQKIAISVLTPDRENKRQNGRRFKTDGEPMFTLTAQDRHGILIKEATKQGYATAEIGDSVNLSHPNSKTRRGRVGKQIANTLLTGESQGVVEPDFRIRKLTPRECWRLQGFPDWAFDKAQEVNSNSQLYKQAGNSVTVNVIAAIAKELL